jgi:protein-S-isoprenylcysteine O-methyltransferase Ste14
MDNQTANRMMLGLALGGSIFFAVAFARGTFTRGRDPGAARDLRSWLGLVLQAIGMGLVWNMPRPSIEPIVPSGGLMVQASAVILCAGLVIAAVWLSWSAFATIGAQWSVGARLRSDHALVTSGPYAFVRHPIYSAGGALVIATGLAIAVWPALVAGTIAYGVGTVVRVRCEEALLRARFGAQFDRYAKCTGALLPRLRRISNELA